MTASALAAVGWAGNYHLIILGTLAFAAAHLGRMARRRRWINWVKLHITGMGTSYISLLTAFYVDNGKSLPFGEIPWSPIGWRPPWLGYWSLFVRGCGTRWPGPDNRPPHCNRQGKLCALTDALCTYTLIRLG